MSMLAGPRQKKEYRLLPKGKPLYEDESNFGSRMLQKMGWSKGKGLGANEDGNKEFIRVKYKNDANGLGFKDRDDGWTQHKNEFETLLKSLNNSLENSDEEQELPAAVGFGFQNASSKKEESLPKLSGESLEEKSKNSKVRVHYKKFTRGKDLSQYSEKDLANIFGKKTLDITKEEPQKLEEVAEEKADVEERVFGVQVINTGTSVNDYFKNKMALLKSGRKQKDACDENQKSSEDNSLGNEEFATENLSSEKKKASIEKVETACNYPIDCPTEEVQKIKKKKKQNLEAITPMDIARDEDDSAEVASKKKKKRKNVDDENSTSLEDVRDNELAEESVEKKSKKKKKDLNDTEVELTNISEGNETGEVIFKKKSKKKKQNLDEVSSHQVAVENSKATELSIDNETCEEVEKKSKKKKRKLEDEGVKTDSCENEELDNVNITEKKSNKKKKTFEDLPHPEADPIPSRSKKSKKDNLHHFNTEDTSNVEDNKTGKELPSDIEQSSTSENISETIANNSEEINKLKKSKKSKKQRKESEVSQGISETENAKATSTVSENEISSTPTYKINSFVAEVFRHTDIGGFVGSNLSEIVGYTLSENVVLDVTQNGSDETRILEMWENAISMHQELQKQQRLQSENKQESGGAEPAKKTYKNRKRHKIRKTNIFRLV